MSSPISPVPADYRDVLLAAVVDVAENSLFAIADVSDQAAFDASAAGVTTGEDWLRAAIRFRGPVDGCFALVVPCALARDLSAAFAGAETPDEIGDGDLLDFTGELANMMCGTWLTRACRAAAFNLTPPCVVRSGPERETGVPTSDGFYLAINDTPIRLEIAWDAAAPPGWRPLAKAS